MIDAFPFNGYPVGILGLGRSGLATARALMKSGAEVHAWDDNEAAREKAIAEGIPVTDLMTLDWRDVPTLIAAPGVPLTHPEPHPVIAKVLSEGAEVIGDIEVLARTERNAAYVGITGTNGKSTTTALIGHIMELAGRDIQMGGNLGTPALELMPLGQDGTYVLEMSSYQLDLTKSITFDVAVLLNISPDHLDRHGGLEGYIKAKKQIFNRQTDPRTAIVGIDDEYSVGIYNALAKIGDQRVIAISGRERIPGGVYVEDGILIDDMDGGQTPVCDLKSIYTLPGNHNWQNAAAAYGAARSVGIEPHVIMACLNSYPGLVHRQQMLDTVDGIRFVNDSKATNVDAAARALGCYENIYWIAGGRAKEKNLDGLPEDLSRIKHAFLIGEAAPLFAAELDGKVTLTQSGTLEQAFTDAVDQAKADGLEGAVVLLSPAAASFDQFENFEVRGDVFAGLVENLDGDHVDPFEDAVDQQDLNNMPASGGLH